MTTLVARPVAPLIGAAIVAPGTFPVDVGYDVDFGRRWSDWLARGARRDRAMRERFRIAGLTAATTGMLTAILYVLLFM
jgi:hypothetical protein